MYEEQQQEQEQPQGYPTQQPMMPNQMSEGLLQYQIDSNEIIEEIEHVLKAEIPRVDPKTAELRWVKPEGIKPMINAKGINSITTILKSRLTKIFILSDFDEESINKMTISVGGNVIDELYYNWEEYEIPTTSAASTILNLVTDTVYATLRKGYLGNYLKFLKTAAHIQETQVFSEGRRQQQGMSQQDKPSFLPFLNKKRR